MAEMNDFVFWDKTHSRLNKLLRRLLLMVFLVDILAILALLAIFTPPDLKAQSPNFFQNTEQVINYLSTKTPGQILTTGTGPYVGITKEGNNFNIIRPEIEKQKIAILTFDDGPDTIYTQKILDVLKREGVPAVFFVVGEQVFKYPGITRQIVESGSQIGAHTFSHVPENTDLYRNGNTIPLEMDFPQKLITASTGYKTKLFRIPYWGAEDTITMNSLVLLAHAQSRGYSVLTSTIDSHDWNENNSGKIADNSFDPSKSQVILLHDAGGNRSATIQALPEIIRKYKQAGFTFTTADPIYGNTPMMVEASLVERFESYFAFTSYWLIVYRNLILDTLFKTSLVIVGLGISILILLSIIHSLKSIFPKKDRFTGLVTVIVPAYNEEKTIGKTIKSLLQSDYEQLEILVVNNNSTDNTAGVVEMYLGHDKIKLINEPRQGKFHALNTGIEQASAEVVVIVDADTQVMPDTIGNLVFPMNDEKLGATAGNVKVGNVNNILTGLQQLEYIVSLQIDRRAYEILHSVPVVPGALGAWRKSALLQVGGYLGDTLTEDAELTIRLQRYGYRIKFVPNAVAFTEAPHTLGLFLKQRRRWTFGMLQVFFKNRDTFFKPKYGFLGMIVLPYLFLIQLPMMVFSPIVDLLAILFFFFVSPKDTLIYFTIFLGMHFSFATIALLLARETRIYLLLLVPIQRFLYQVIWYYILYKSIITALEGRYLPWIKLNHEGQVNLGETKEKIYFAPEVASGQAYSN
jgi:peptidoglycan-N-acetylglucosamine deacetylase